MQFIDSNIKMSSFEYYAQDSNDINNLVLYIIFVRILYEEGWFFALDD